LKFYPVLSLIYLVMGVGWGFRMFLYKDHVIFLHKLVLLLIIVTVVQCLVTFGVYSNSNEVGDTSSELVLISIILEVIRSTFAKVVTLLVGLGYGICLKSF